MSFLKYIFSIDTKSSNRIIVYFLGIKFRHLKPDVKKSGQKFIQLDCPVSEIPKATGTLRKIQLANLKMLQIFDNLCKDNGLEYWLDFGNLLGAVRHKGFIPWDDDVDVSMVRDDYEKFIKLFSKGIPQYEDLYLEFNNNGKNKCFLKILHKKFPNIAVDVFPYDFYYRQINDEQKLEITKEIKKLINNRFYKLLYPFFINNPEGMRRRFIKLRDEKILKHNIPDKRLSPPLFYAIDYPHTYNNYFFDYDKIFPLKKIKYEDLEFSSPNNPDFILKQTFGDYMQLPEDCYPRHANSDGFKGETAIELDKFIGDIYAK